MSLILDALKKSDQNRQRGKVPDLQADHSLPAAAPPLRPWPRRLLLLLVLLTGGAGAALWWLWPAAPQAPLPVVQRQPVAVPVPPPPPVPAAEPAPVAAPQPALVGPPQAPASTAPAPQPQASPAPVHSEPPEIYDLADLPPQLRQGLPELAVSVHYFTAEPAARMVRINNRILREGGELPGGIRIEAIEADGVLCTIQGVRFRLPKTTVESN